MKKIIMLTGVTGFIGRRLLNIIEMKYKDKFEIILLTSQNFYNHKTILHKNYTFKKSDFLKCGIKEIDTIIHIGAFIPKDKWEVNNLEKSNSNIYRTQYLLDNIPNIPNRFIFLSTLDVYGNIKSVINEESTSNPLTMYGWSKLYCEKMIEGWAQANDVVIQILRLGHIYGVGEENYKKLIPLTIKKIKNEENPIIFGKGDERRSFLYLDDACNLIIKSIFLEKYKGVINLVSSKSYTIKEIVGMLLEISGKKLKIEYKEISERGLDFVADTSKMNILLGYEETNIREGLKIEFNSIKKRLEYIFLDLDGPILEGKNKHYQCYKDIVEKYGGNILDIDTYWDMKTSKVTRDILLNKTNFCGSYEIFLKEWIDRIETEEYLVLDYLQPAVLQTLKQWKNEALKIVLVTMRQNRKSLIRQLEKFKIYDFFDEIIDCSPQRKNSKYEALKNKKFQEALFIGDTEEDMNTARLLNIKSIGITTGLRKKEFLEADFYFEKISDINFKELE